MPPHACTHVYMHTCTCTHIHAKMNVNKLQMAANMFIMINVCAHVHECAHVFGVAQSKSNMS